MEIKITFDDARWGLSMKGVLWCNWIQEFEWSECLHCCGRIKNILLKSAAWGWWFISYNYLGTKGRKNDVNSNIQLHSRPHSGVEMEVYVSHRCIILEMLSALLHGLLSGWSTHVGHMPFFWHLNGLWHSTYDFWFFSSFTCLSKISIYCILWIQVVNILWLCCLGKWR